MSSFDPEEFKKSISNAIEIAGFIQKNREQIAKTYGRSAIQGPPSRLRIQEWEKFYQDSIQEQKRHDVIGDPHERDEKTNGENSGDRSGSSNDRTSLPAGPLLSTVHFRDNRSGNGEDNNGTSDEGGDGSSDSDECSDTAGHPDTDGDDQSAKCDGILQAGDGSTGELGLQCTGGSPVKTGRSGIKFSNDDKVNIPDIDDVISEQDASAPRILKSHSYLEELASLDNFNVPAIKKTTEENSASQLLQEESSVRPGVIQPVPGLDLNQDVSNVDAGNAHQSAHYVNMTGSPLDQAGHKEISDKLDNLLINQGKILEKLTAIGEIKEEITGIKKSITNLGLAISTIESYINSLLIVIPKSGKDEKRNEVEINPDLKMVIGRDNRRGLNDFDMQKVKIVDDKFGEEIFEADELDKSALLDDIDKDKNHAAKFVPSNDTISYRVIEEMIKRKVHDRSVRDGLLEIVHKNKIIVPAENMYSQITMIIDNMPSA
ncbi:phosphoprotein [Wufeng Murina leucogaster paramyxovirus 1]|nr:phosphoprotein [Wufeng Murina leucogaster paramyxovirus 1]